MVKTSSVLRALSHDSAKLRTSSAESTPQTIMGIVVIIVSIRLLSMKWAIFEVLGDYFWWFKQRENAVFVKMGKPFVNLRTL